MAPTRALKRTLPYADLDEIIGEDLHKTPIIQACVVMHVPREQKKTHRDLTQDEIAELLLVDSRRSVSG